VFRSVVGGEIRYVVYVERRAVDISESVWPGQGVVEPLNPASDVPYLTVFEDPDTSFTCHLKSS
jgi:hypothetical protein